MVGAPNEPSRTASPRSLSKNSAARFAAELAALIVGALSATLTARWLGPSTKGTLAALTFVTGLLAQVCLLGLPDAAMVRVGRREASTQEALACTLAGTVLAAMAGSIVLLLYASLQLPLHEPFVRAAVFVACVSLPLAVSATTLLIILNTQERMVASSAIFLLMSATTAVSTVVLVGPFRLSVLGGALGTLIGAAGGLVVARVMLRGQGLRFRPRLDRGYLGPALRFGLRIQLAYALTVAAARFDLLLVYSLAGRADAGVYSVALTFGTLSGTVGASLSYAAFPRLSRLNHEEAHVLIAQLVRVALAAAVVIGVALSATLPVFIGLVLGRAYSSAILPALLLLVGGLFWSGQWVLARSYAARGDPSLLFSSFLLNVLTMLALDVVLIPRWESIGAAIASVAGAAVGLAICLHGHRRASGRSLTELLPRLGDARELARFALRPFRASNESGLLS